MDSIWLIPIILVPIMLAMFSGMFFLIYKKRNKVLADVENKLNTSEVFTINSFIDMYENIKRNNIRLNDVDKPGVYVILNKTKNMNYVGQSKRVLQRINQHITGKGNGDVYADFKYVDDFEVFVIKCDESELDIVEKNLIKKYEAFSKGYNRNRGVGRFF